MPGGRTPAAGPVPARAGSTLLHHPHRRSADGFRHDEMIGAGRGADGGTSVPVDGLGVDAGVTPMSRACVPRRERLAERIGAAAYGTVLVLSALALVEVTEVGIGHGVELVVGVGLATWIAHLFAELLAEHVRHDRAAHLAAGAAGGRRRQSRSSWSTVLPAAALLLGGSIWSPTRRPARWRSSSPWPSSA